MQNTTGAASGNAGGKRPGAVNIPLGAGQLGRLLRREAQWPGAHLGGPGAPAAVTRTARADGNAPWCAGPLAQPLPAPLRYQHLLEGVEVLNAFARAEHDRLQRIFGQMDR